MATYKVVDADQLDADMTALANAIRTKGGTSGSLAWPEGYKSAVEAIETGGGNKALDALISRDITEVESDATKVGNYAFYMCRKLVAVDCPKATSVSGYAFNTCSELKSVSLPKVRSLSVYAFRDCDALTALKLPSVTSVDTSSISRCAALTTVDLPVISSIGGNAFNGDSALVAVLLRSTATVAVLTSSNAFANTPIASGTGYIYVPSALVSGYQAATNWSTYAAQFRALEDYTVDGTTTGELDPTKTGT